MAVDYGDARTGVAVSDAAGLLTGFTAVLSERNRDRLLLQLLTLIETHRPERIVVGLPRNMDGSCGPRAALCREFASCLAEQTEAEVLLWDERCTSVEAHQILRTSGKQTKKHRKTVDAVAASLILEGYLHALQNADRPEDGADES